MTNEYPGTGDQLYWALHEPVQTSDHRLVLLALTTFPHTFDQLVKVTQLDAGRVLVVLGQLLGRGSIFWTWIGVESPAVVFESYGYRKIPGARE